MTLEERLAALPTDRHVQYYRAWVGSRLLWVARWRDDARIRRAVTLGPTLPALRPDTPCLHLPYRWPVPTTDAERREAAERGRRANALRKVRSNQYRKQREVAS